MTQSRRRGPGPIFGDGRKDDIIASRELFAAEVMPVMKADQAAR